ncbi:prepilin peptidase [Candidatus Woesearchaeota archaeon]|nr:prepilin peptidase [Candidatus Woesearchaeota archaeon]
MMVSDILLTIVAVFGVGAAAIHDSKTREVPDWISYSLLATGFGIRAIAALGPETASYFLSAFLGLGITYLLGTVMYYAKQWGGGDAKLIMGLGVIYATRPSFLPTTSTPFLGILFINMLLFGAVYGLLWGIILAWKNRKKFTTVAKQLLQEKRMVKTRITALVLAAITFTASFFLPDLFLRISIMTFALIILLYPYLWIYVKAVEKACLYKYLKPQQLTEGDWVEENIVVNKRIIYRAKNTGIEKEDIQKLIKARVNRVLIKEGIPFVPAFFFGLLATLLQIKIIAFP